MGGTGERASKTFGQAGPWLVAACLVVPACKEDGPLPSNRPRPAPVAEEAPSARVAPIVSRALAERDTTLDEQDPAVPPSDLAGEIAMFTDLPTCVKRRKLDPLLADGFETLGYENFAWDSCRMVQAMKEGTPAACEKMMVSSMKRRCQADMAAVSGKAEACPLTEVFPRFQEREPACLAAARRDVRPCAALVKQERATCEAVVAHDPSRCGVDARCLRHVGRMRGLLPTVLGKTPPATRLVLIVKRKDEHEPSGLREERFDLSDEAAAGVTVVLRPVGAGIVLGKPTLPAVFTPGRAYLGFLGDLSEATLAGKEGAVTVGRFWIQLPTGESLELNGGTTLKARAELWADQVDAPLVLLLSGTTGGQGTPREVSVRLETWVRDRVSK